MPFYFLRKLFVPEFKIEAPVLTVTSVDNEQFRVKYGLHHFTKPSLGLLNANLLRAVKSDYEIEYFDDVRKNAELKSTARTVKTQIDRREIQREQGRNISINADWKDIRVGALAGEAQKSLLKRHDALEKVINEGVKFQKLEIWRNRLKDILIGNVRKKEDIASFMNLFSEVWGENPSQIILMQEFAKQFQLKDPALKIEQLGPQYVLAFNAIQFLPESLQDNVAEYLLTELISKITTLLPNEPAAAQSLLEKLKSTGIKKPANIIPVLTQFESILNARQKLLANNGSDEESLAADVKEFYEKVRCIDPPAKEGAPSLPKRELIIHLSNASQVICNQIIRAKNLKGSNAKAINDTLEIIKISHHGITKEKIDQVYHHYLFMIAQNINEPIKTAEVIKEAEASLQKITVELNNSLNQRRREAARERAAAKDRKERSDSDAKLADDTQSHEARIEKANLALAAIKESEFLSDYLATEHTIKNDGYSVDESTVIFARYIHKPADLMEKAKYLTNALTWCDQALEEVNEKVRDVEDKNLAIEELNKKKSEVVRAQQALAYEMFLIIKNVAEKGNVNRVNMVQLVLENAQKLGLINGEVFKSVYPQEKSFPFGECLFTQFIDYIDTYGDLNVRNQLKQLNFPQLKNPNFQNGQHLSNNPAIPLRSHGALHIPAIDNIHFIAEGMVPKEEPYFFQVNSKARYKLIKNSNFAKVNLLISEINLAMQIAHVENGMPLGEAEKYKVLQWIETARALLQQERRQLESIWTGGGDFDENYHKAISHAENILYRSANELAAAISARLNVTFSQEKDFLMSKQSLDRYKSFVSTYGNKGIQVNEVGRSTGSINNADYTQGFIQQTDFLNNFLERVVPQKPVSDGSQKYLMTDLSTGVLNLKKLENGQFAVQHDADLCERYHIAVNNKETKQEINAVLLIAAIITGQPSLTDYFNKCNQGLAEKDKLKVSTKAEVKAAIITVISPLTKNNRKEPDRKKADELITTITQKYISNRSLSDLTNSQVELLDHFDNEMWKNHDNAMKRSNEIMIVKILFRLFNSKSDADIRAVIDLANSKEMQACFSTEYRNKDGVITQLKKEFNPVAGQIAPHIISNVTRLLSFQDSLRIQLESGYQKEGQAPLPGLVTLIKDIKNLNDIRLPSLERIIINIEPPSNIILATYRVELLNWYFSKPGANRAIKKDMSEDQRSLIDAKPTQCHFTAEQIRAIEEKINDPLIVTDPSLLRLVRDIIKCEIDVDRRNDLLERLKFSAIYFYLKNDASLRSVQTHGEEFLDAKKKLLDEALEEVSPYRGCTQEEENKFIELLRLKGNKVNNVEINDNIGQNLVLDEVSRVSYPATLATILKYLPPVVQKAATHTLSIKLIQSYEAIKEPIVSEELQVGKSLPETKEVSEARNMAEVNKNAKAQNEVEFNNNLSFIKTVLSAYPKDIFFDEKQSETIFSAIKLYIGNGKFEIWPLLKLFVEHGGKEFAAAYTFSLIKQIVFTQVGFRNQAEFPEEKDLSKITKQATLALREKKLSNEELKKIVNECFTKEQKEELVRFAKEHRYTGDQYVRTLFTDILEELGKERRTLETEKNVPQPLEISTNVYEAISWLQEQDSINPANQSFLDQKIGDAIELGHHSVEHRDAFFQGFLNEILVRFQAAQPDIGKTTEFLNDEIAGLIFSVTQDDQNKSRETSQSYLLNKTMLHLIYNLLGQLKREIPIKYTPKGHQQALAALTDNNQKEDLIKEYDEFQQKHHYELNFLRYLCRYLISVDHTNLIAHMNAKDAEKYVAAIRAVFLALESERKDIPEPKMPSLPPKADVSTRQQQIERHKKTVQIFYADQGYLSVMSPSAIDKQLKQAVAKKIIQLYSPADKKENAKSLAEIKKSVSELLPMTDINALSTEFRDLVDKGWFARPIMEDPNWLKTEKGELFESATTAAKFLENALLQQISPPSNSMITQAVVDWLYIMAKQIALYPHPIDRVDLPKEKQKQLADFEKFIKDFLPNTDVKSLSRRELIIRLLASGPNAGGNETSSLYVLISKINEFENLNISNDRTALKQLEEALHKSRDTITSQVLHARSTALQLYTMLSAEDVQLSGKEKFLNDFSDHIKKLLDKNEFPRTRDFIIVFNKDVRERKVALQNFKNKIDGILNDDPINYQVYRAYLDAMFSPIAGLEESAKQDNNVSMMFNGDKKLQLDLALYNIGKIAVRLSNNVESKNFEAAKNEIELLLVTYSYLIRSHEDLRQTVTKVVYDIFSKMISEKRGDVVLEVTNRFITDAIGSKRQDIVIELLYLLGKTTQDNIKQIEHTISEEEEKIRLIKSKIAFENEKYQSLAVKDATDKSNHAILNEFLVSTWSYEERNEVNLKNKEQFEELQRKNQKNAYAAGFNKAGTIYESIPYKDLDNKHQQRREELLNSKLVRIASVFLSVDQLLISIYKSVIKEITSENPDVKLNALAQLSVISYLIDQMPHKPQYLLDLKTICDKSILNNPITAEDKGKFSQLGIKNKSELEQDIQVIAGNEKDALKNLYDIWQKASPIAGHLNTALVKLMPIKGNIQEYNTSITKIEKRIADQKAMLQIPLQYQTGVKSFLFVIKNVASSLVNKVISMVNWFWSGSAHQDNANRNQSAVNTSESLKAHLISLLDSKDEENYKVIFQTYENPLLDNVIKKEIRDIYLRAVQASSTYLRSLKQQYTQHNAAKNWAAAVPIAFKLININTNDSSYMRDIWNNISSSFWPRDEKSLESDKDYYQRVFEGIKLLAELYKSDEFLNNDEQIKSLREAAKKQFINLLNNCDVYRIVDKKRVVNQVNLHILSVSTQLLTLILPIKTDVEARDIYNALLMKVDNSLQELLKNSDAVPIAIKFFYGICPPVKDLAAKSLWTMPLTDEQIKSSYNRNVDLRSKLMSSLPTNAQTIIPGFKQAMIDYFGDKADAILGTQKFDKNDTELKTKLFNMVEKLDSIFLDELTWMNAFDLDDANKEEIIYDALKHAMDTFLSNDQLKKFLSNLDNRLIKDHKNAEQIYARFAPAVIASFSRIQSNPQEYKTLKVYFSLDKLTDLKNKLDRKQVLLDEEKANFENYCKDIMQFGDTKQKKYAEDLLSKQHDLERKAEEPEISLTARIASAVTFGYFGGAKKTKSSVATPTQAPNTLLSTPRAQPSPAATPRAATPTRTVTPIVPPAAASTSAPSVEDQSRAQKWAAAPSPAGTAKLMQLPGTSGSQAPQQPTQEASKPILITLPENISDIMPAIGNGLCGYNSIALQIGLAAVQYQQKPNDDLFNMLEKVYNELKKINKNRTIFGEQNLEQFCNKLAVFMSTEEGRTMLQTFVAPHLFTLAHAEIGQDKQRFLEFAKQEVEAAFEVFSYRAITIGYDEAIKQLRDELSQGELNEILDDSFYRNFTAQLHAAYDVSRIASAGKVPTAGQFEAAVSNAKLEIGKYFNTIAEQYWTKRNNNRWLGQYEIDKLGKKLDFKAKIYRQKDNKWEVVTVVGKEKAKVDLDMARTGVHYDALLTDRHKHLLVPPSQRHRP